MRETLLQTVHCATGVKWDVAVGDDWLGQPVRNGDAIDCSRAFRAYWTPATSTTNASLILRSHSLCADATSLVVLGKELDALLRGEAPGPTIQFADATEWQHEVVEACSGASSAERQADLAVAYLGSVTAGAIGEAYTPGRVNVSELARRAAALATRFGLAPEDWTLALWRIALHCALGLPSLVVWRERPGRAEDLRDCVGPYAVYQPIFGEVHDDWDWRRTLQAVSRANGSSATWEAPLVSREFTPICSESQLVQAFRFGFRYTRWPVLDLVSSGAEIMGCTAPFDMALELDHQASGVVAAITYNSETQAAASVPSLVQHLSAVIERFENARSLDDPKLITDAPSKNRTNKVDKDKRYGEQDPYQLIHRQLSARGDAVAALASTGSATYAEIAVRVNLLVTRLVDAGVAPGRPLAIALGRDIEFVVAILAALRIGAPWVVLSPDEPAQALAQLHELRVHAVLTDTRWTARWEGYDGGVLSPDGRLLSGRAADTPAQKLAGPVGPAWPAYILFTSGSGGEPKPVVLTRGALAHYLQALQERLELDAADRYLVTADFSFSSSVRQLLLPLSVGATVVLADTLSVIDAYAIRQSVHAHAITVIDVVPSCWASTLRALRTSNAEFSPGALRYCLFASDHLSRDVADECRKLWGDEVQLVNMYGQTETTGIVSTWFVPRELETDANSLPIGVPLPGIQLEVLDDWQPVDGAVVGELVVSGPTLMDGYARSARVTAERMLPGSQGDRVLRTMDVVRRLPDGTCQLLGRRDDVVKVHGVRVSTLQIEQILAQHPAVKEAIVLVRDTGHGQGIVASVLPHVAQAPTDIELRQFLVTRVPLCMVPERFQLVRRWPTTRNGKVDRQALLGMSTAAKRAVVRAPTVTEEQLIELWKVLLPSFMSDVKAGFFESGGDSILGVHLLRQVEERFGVYISSSEFYGAETLDLLANIIDRKLAERGASAHPIIRGVL